MRVFRKWPLAVLVVALAAYLGDAGLLQIRLHHGTAYKTIQVDQFLKTPLKGQKEEYDFTGQVQVSCVRSMFPQLSSPPCWWVERHQAQWQ